MKVARSVSLDVEVLQTIADQAQAARVSVSRWIEEACREKVEREKAATPARKNPRSGEDHR